MADIPCEMLDLREEYHEYLFQKFLIIYNATFRDSDIREEPNDWIERLKIKDVQSPQPITHILIVGKELKNMQNAVVYGGLIFEFYIRSSCGLLTYLVIDPLFRKKGIGKDLVKRSQEILNKDAESLGGHLNAIFAETEDPRININKNYTEHTERLIILSTLGGKWVPISYIQPALGASKHRANLLLLTFPTEKSEKEFTVNGLVLRTWLNEFYRALDIDYPEKDDDFNKMDDEIGKGVQIKEIPKIETPIMRFNHIGVCFHIATIEKETVAIMENSRKYFQSYEIDLLKRQYQKEPPILTFRDERFVNIPITIHLGNEIEYKSEGRTEALLTEEPNLKARIVVSHSFFHTTNIHITHMVFKPSEDSFFNEYHIIKLLKIYAGIQEQACTEKLIKFSWGSSSEKTFHQLVQDCTGLPNENGRSIISGTVDSELGWGGSNDSWSNVEFLRISQISGHDKAENALGKLKERFSKNDQNSIFLKSLCGIVTGIFDYKRMNFQELLDTLVLVDPESSDIIWINRGTFISLVNCEGRKEEERAHFNNIGISPYLIVTQSVLLHNGILVEQCLQELEEILQKAKTTKIPVNELEQKRERISLKLHTHFLPNPFHYESEKTFYEKEITERGILHKLDVALNKVAELAATIETARNEKSERSKYWTNILLAILSGFTLHPVIYQLCEDIMPKGYNKIYFWLIFLFTFMVIILLIGFFNRPRRSRGKDDV